MKIHSGLETFQAKQPVVTIGMFDGLHLGHRHLISSLVQKARQINGESVLISFWPHPRFVLHQNSDNLRFLTSLEEKTRMLSEMHIDHLVLLPFTPQLAAYSSEEFVEKILVRSVGVAHLLMGFNHRFGKDGTHDWHHYTRLAEKFGFGISREEPLLLNGQFCSSSLIRQFLNEGQLAEANLLLGYAYPITGRVIGGNRLGRTIGYPTANIETEDREKLIPHKGVYACRVHTEGQNYWGMLNIGNRPTITPASQTVSIEVHILDFQHDIYSEIVTLSLEQRMRDEVQFTSLDALKRQLVVDEKNIREFFAR